VSSLETIEQRVLRTVIPNIFPQCLDNLAGPGLLPERVGSLTGEAHQETVRELVVNHKFLDVLHGLGHGDALDAGLPPQLLHHHPPLLHMAPSRTFTATVASTAIKCTGK